MTDHNERTALYRLYDSGDRLLYVGIAKDPERRWWQHARDRADSWWPDVARKSVEWFDTREAAEGAEVEAIKREGPPYNSAHIVSWNPPPGCKRQASVPSERVRQYQSALRERGIRFMRESERLKVSVPELVASKLRASIDSGIYPVGSRLPTNSALCQHFGISGPTLSRGIALLKADGLLAVRPGHGTFVVAKP